MVCTSLAAALVAAQAWGQPSAKPGADEATRLFEQGKALYEARRQRDARP